MTDATSLSDLQSKVHVAKDKKNDFGGYNYRTAEGILSAIKAQMPEGGHITVSDEIQEVGGHIFVSSTATLYLPDAGEYTAKGHALHPITKKGMDPSQITGAASSYARKYALSGLMALDDGSVDPDASQKPYEEDKTAEIDAAILSLSNADTLEDLRSIFTDIPPNIRGLPQVVAKKDEMKAAIEAKGKEGAAND